MTVHGCGEPVGIAGARANEGQDTLTGGSPCDVGCSDWSRPGSGSDSGLGQGDPHEGVATQGQGTRMRIVSVLLVILLLAPSALPWAHAQATGASAGRGAPRAGPRHERRPVAETDRQRGQHVLDLPATDRAMAGQPAPGPGCCRGREARRHPSRISGSSGSPRCTDVDKESRLWMLEDFSFVKRPTSRERRSVGIDTRCALNDALPSQPIQIALDRLQANLEVTQAIGRRPRVPVRNTPSRIIYSARLAMLVLTDGKPVLRPGPGYCLLLWVIGHAGSPPARHLERHLLPVAPEPMGTGAGPRGPWAAATSVPPALETAKQQAIASKQVNLDDFTPQVKQALEQGQLPVIYVSTGPGRAHPDPGAGPVPAHCRRPRSSR